MLRQSMDVVAVGIEMGLAVGFGLFAGNWADDRFGTAPWLLLIGLVVGFGAAVKAVMRAVKKVKQVMDELDDDK